MSKEELQQALEFLGWMQVSLACRLGVTPKQVLEWKSGRAEVPGYAAEYLGMMVEVKTLYHRMFREEDI